MRGKLIGDRYRIQSQIGEGGMANVYLAIDEKLQRKVAVKIMHAHMSKNDDLRRRFFWEAHAISGLEHPNILKVFDFSGQNSKDLWIVSEVLSGVNLNEYVQGLPDRYLHPIIAALIVREVLKALDVAHHKEIIHRDIKPENIFMLNEGRIKLMDFGIAKNMRENSLTMTGTFMGSPSYMSPEQIKGKALDQRTDLYSLGVLFYEIATGQLPYRGHSTHDVIIKICEAKLVDPKKIKPHIPEDINNIIVKAMAFKPGLRYQESKSFAADLDIFLKASGFVESHIELERYVKDRARFEQRLDVWKEQLSQSAQPASVEQLRPISTQQISAHSQKPTLPQSHQSVQSTHENIEVASMPQPVSQHKIIAVTHHNPQVTYAPQPQAMPRRRPRKKHRVVYRTVRRRSSLDYVAGFLVIGALLLAIFAGFFEMRKFIDQYFMKVESKTQLQRPHVNKNQPPRRLIQQRKLRSKESVLTSKSQRSAQRSQQQQQKPQERQLAVPEVKNIETYSVESKAKFGYIQIASTPASEIFIDGKKVSTTNASGVNSGWLKVDSGRHRLELRRAGEVKHRQQIDVRPGQRLNLDNIQLTSVVLNVVQFIVEPPGADVRVISQKDNRVIERFTSHAAPATLTLKNGDYIIDIRYELQKLRQSLHINHNVKQNLFRYSLPPQSGGSE